MNSSKKSERVPLLNFEGVQGSHLQTLGWSRVSPLNFDGGHGFWVLGSWGPRSQDPDPYFTPCHWQKQPMQVSYKKTVLKNFAISTGNYILYNTYYPIIIIIIIIINNMFSKYIKIIYFSYWMGKALCNVVPIKKIHISHTSVLYLEFLKNNHCFVFLDHVIRS